MKTATIAGIVLLALGFAALAYQGFTYSRHEKSLNIGSIHGTKKEIHHLPLAPVIGCLSLIGGVVLLASGAKNDPFDK